MKREQPYILIVEDDLEIQSLLKDYLLKHEFLVEVADGGAQFDRLVSYKGLPDLIVLDVMLPGEDGLSICRRVRVNSQVPILFLTAKGDDIERIIGLEMGADDYMPKPFNPRELVARIRAILKRTSQSTQVETSQLSVGSLVVDREARNVKEQNGSEIKLTSAEFDLLECFVNRPGRVLSRDQLMDWTRGRTAEAFDRTIDVQVSRLRKKIETGSEPMIKTLRNSGYQLCVPVKPIQGH